MKLQIPNQGKKTRTRYWNICVILGIIGFILVGASGTDEPPTGVYNYNTGLEWSYTCEDGEVIQGVGSGPEDDGFDDCMDGSDEGDSTQVGMEMCGSLTCCMSLIFAISALTTKVDNQQVVVIQQQPQYVPVVQQVVQQPVIRQQVVQPVPQPVAQPRPTPTAQTTTTDWARKAKNLEMARNWEEAAKAYEKAGLYQEAGKIRQENLEHSQPMVQIGQVGNTVLNDSVMINDGGQKTCSSCGNVVEASWNICPYCSSQI